MARHFFIGVDFDGTIVDHRFPDVGEALPGAFSWMRSWEEAGASLILWTMRSDGPSEGPMLSEAVAFCKEKGQTFYAVNENPTQRSWTSSPKLYCQVLVDDSAFGCPLRPGPRVGSRPAVDWSTVGPAVLAMTEAHFSRSQYPDLVWDASSVRR